MSADESSGRAATEGKPSTPGRCNCPCCTARRERRREWARKHYGKPDAVQRWRAALRDIDEIAVARAMSGERIPLTRAERFVAVRRMRAKGYTTHQIAERLHMSGHQVKRDLDNGGWIARVIQEDVA